MLTTAAKVVEPMLQAVIAVLIVVIILMLLFMLRTLGVGKRLLRP